VRSRCGAVGALLGKLHNWRFSDGWGVMRLERALDSIQRAINHKLDYARYLRQHPPGDAVRQFDVTIAYSDD